MPTRYELLYIIPATLTDEEVGGVETKVSAILTKDGATTESTRRLGKYRLAYPIGDQRHGHYMMVLLSVEPSMLAKIDEHLRLMNDVVRHLIVRAEEGGAETKFDLVQFTEVSVEQDRPKRRERVEEKEGEVAADKKDKPKEPEKELSAEDLDKKIETALSEDIKGV